MALNWWKRGLAALGIATSTLGGLAAPAAARDARPALWQVSDADTKIYLFGTIHLLPEGLNWRTPTFDKAVADSQELVVETVIDEKNPQKMGAIMAKLGLRAGLPPLLDRVPPARRTRLQAAVQSSGVPLAAYNRLETWAAAFTLLGLQFRSMDLKSEQGVEQVLRSSFTTAGKPIGELETNEQQLGFFDQLPEAAQRSLLESATEQPAAVKGEFDKMLGAWTSGDPASIARAFNADMQSSPALMDVLLKRRNANWARWIENRMQQPGTIMIAVGAGHLAGSSSVLALLAKDGYKVRRLQ
ncbi:TraB/GumN family protein [Sphingomonas ginkgonis]|uniref:TraB/GumN family protein n=1 Tax=Sphingomonas ginkgonis TaxID=2315330 RepID=UPI00163AB8FC|nr:TraB/GumN family protein [Sphingomonas ginkgonis]